MNPLASLRGRIFLSTALLTVLSIGMAIYLVSVRVSAELEGSLERNLASTASLVEQLRTTRTQTYVAMARLIADTPKLKAAVDTNDPPTVQDTVDDYQAQLESSVLLVTNRHGDLLATVGATRDDATAVAREAAIGDAPSGRESLRLLHRPDGILHLVTVPIALGVAQPDLLGTLSVGFLLDDAFAAQLKTITGSDLAFGIAGEVVSGTLPAADRALLSARLAGGEAEGPARLHGEDYAVRPLRLELPTDAADRGQAVALILRSRSEDQRFMGQINAELAGTAVVAVLLATLLSFAVARTITRPLAALTGVMREVASTGDLTRKLVLRGDQRWHDEDARLLATTFNTLTDSIARAQREMSQRERFASLGRLSTVIAHEVRNPLMIIKAALHGLRRPGIAPGELREIASDIDGEVARLNRMVNDVLDFARPIRFDLAAVDLNEVCRDSAAAAQATPGAAITLDLDPSVGQVVTDAERLRAALVNLLVNARHAVEGREPALVRLATERGATGVTIVVADTGVGIDAADLTRVFEPFFTTRRGGTGLGLAITRNIVDGLGGTIAASSEPGRGTEMRIVLPLASPAVPAVHSGSDLPEP